MSKQNSQSSIEINKIVDQKVNDVKKSLEDWLKKKESRRLSRLGVIVSVLTFISAGVIFVAGLASYNILNQVDNAKSKVNELVDVFELESKLINQLSVFNGIINKIHLGLNNSNLRFNLAQNSEVSLRHHHYQELDKISKKVLDQISEATEVNGVVKRLTDQLPDFDNQKVGVESVSEFYNVNHEILLQSFISAYLYHIQAKLGIQNPEELDGYDKIFENDHFKSNYFKSKDFSKNDKAPFILLHRGFALQKRGQYKEAIDSYKQILEIEKNDLWAIINLTETYLLNGEYIEALKTINLLDDSIDKKNKNYKITKFYKIVTMHFAQFKLSKNDNQSKQANLSKELNKEINSFVKLIDYKPIPNFETFLFGRLLPNIEAAKGKQCDIYKFVLFIKDLHDYNLKEGYKLTTRAEEFPRSHDKYKELYKEALRLFKKAEKKNEQSFMPLHFIGVANGKLGNHQRAKESFEKLLKKEPNFIKGWHNMGVCCMLDGDYKGALEHLEKAILIGKQNNWDTSLVMWVKSQVQRKLKLYNESILNYKGLIFNEEALEKENRVYTDRAWVQIGLNYEDLNDFKSAFRAYENAIEANADSDVAHNNAAWLLLTRPPEDINEGQDGNQKGAYKKALEYAKKAVEISQDNINLDTLAVAYARNTEFVKAAQITSLIIARIKEKEINEIELDELEKQLTCFIKEKQHDCNSNSADQN